MLSQIKTQIIKRFFGSPIIFFCFLISLCLPAFADGGAENLVLVVNRKQPESLALANQYIDLRKVPASNVVYIDFNLKNETTTIANFKQNILLPVFKAIKERRLDNQINCIVYSSGFPTRISEKAHLDAWLSKTGQKYNIQLHAPWCSINALTYYYQQALNDDLDFFTLNSNRYFRRPVKNLLEEPFSGETQRRYKNALRKMRPREYQEAIKLWKQLQKSHPGNPVLDYQIARSYAFNNQHTEAKEALREAMTKGWCYRTATAKDIAFSSIRDEPSFKTLLAEMPDETYGMLPTRQFKNEINWDQNGWPTSGDDSGQRYIISTVLGVSPSLGGTANLQENLAQLKRTAMADGTRPSGTFFFANHGDVRSRSRAPQFEYAVTELKKLGYSAEIIKTTMPKNQEVLGATLGSAKIPWSDSGSTFAPGAICDNFTSYGGWFSMNQTVITDYIRFGAGGASGSVYEPYAIPPKFPHASIQVHYARGCNLGEAFYQSIASPRYMLIVGDPLCRPFAKLPQFEVRGIRDRDQVRGDFTFSATAKDNSPTMGGYQIFLDGKRIATIQEAADYTLSTAQLGPGFHELRVVGFADDLIAASTSQVFGFTYLKGNVSLKLQASNGSQHQLADSLKLSATSSVGNGIAIMQNSQKVGEIRGKSGQVQVACKKLGLGKTKLYALVLHNEKVTSSIPIEIEINP